MDKRLPSRPNLDHLRQQAKQLLSALRAGDPHAAAEFSAHLPSARGLKPAELRGAGFKLADAQSVVARKHGRASWPKLVRYVEQWMALEGIWGFESLEVDGSATPQVMLAASRIEIDGYRFSTITTEATYEGVFDIDVELQPATIDIEFVAGPEKGNWSHGIFRVEGERWTICLGLTGAPRPTEFLTRPGRGHALETLVRRSRARTPELHSSPRLEVAPVAVQPAVDAAEFQARTATIEALQGAWQPLVIVRDGQELPRAMLTAMSRTMHGTRTQVKLGAQSILDAWTRVNESSEPREIDYVHTSGPCAGLMQAGLVRVVGDELEVCYADVGQPRPVAFGSARGSGVTWSRWKRST